MVVSKPLSALSNITNAKAPTEYPSNDIPVIIFTTLGFDWEKKYRRDMLNGSLMVHCVYTNAQALTRKVFCVLKNVFGPIASCLLLFINQAYSILIWDCLLFSGGLPFWQHTPVYHLHKNEDWAFFLHCF